MSKFMHLKSVVVVLTLCAISLAAGQNPIPQTGFTATLESGVVVELVGVTNYPSKNQSWWQADGVLLAESPYDGNGFNIINVILPDTRPMELALRLSGNAADPVWAADVKQAGGAAVWWGGRRFKNGQVVGNIKSIVVLVGSKRQTLDLSLGIAAGPWKTISTYSTDTNTNQVTNKDDSAISWTKPVVKDDMTKLDVTSSHISENVRVAAVDANGNLQPAGVTFRIGDNTVEADFRPPLSGVKQFVFQTRPYEWVKFTNISLRPAR